MPISRQKLHMFLVKIQVHPFFFLLKIWFEALDWIFSAAIKENVNCLPAYFSALLLGWFCPKKVGWFNLKCDRSWFDRVDEALEFAMRLV